jgi:hypothetical protein
VQKGCLNKGSPSVVSKTTTSRTGGNEKAFALSSESSEMTNHRETEGLIRKYFCFNSCGACNAWKNVQSLLSVRP